MNQGSHHAKKIEQNDSLTGKLGVSKNSGGFQPPKMDGLIWGVFPLFFETPNCQ